MLSPWNRNQTSYGSKYYVEYYKRQLKELLSSYGDIFEVWFDGANGGDGWYGGASEKRTIDRKNYYEFDKLYQIVDSLQPKAIIFGMVVLDAAGWATRKALLARPAGL